MFMFMMDGKIFGPNVSLPCFEGLQSSCEAELIALMKEVDEAFERKHIQLLEELTKASKLCIAQKKEIEKLTKLLPNTQDSEKERLKEKLKLCSSNLEKLKKENDELKSENSALHHKAQRLSEMEGQLGSLKKSLSIQQEENKALREKLSRNEDQYESLKRIVNNSVLLRQGDGIHNERNQVGDRSDVYISSTKEMDIAKTAEKFMSEQKEHNDNFLSEINQEIEKLDKNIQKELET